jgi:hypothetical protein
LLSLCAESSHEFHSIRGKCPLTLKRIEWLSVVDCGTVGHVFASPATGEGPYVSGTRRDAEWQSAMTIRAALPET